LVLVKAFAVSFSPLSFSMFCCPPFSSAILLGRDGAGVAGELVAGSEELIADGFAG
jgi:hypothetical protein